MTNYPVILSGLRRFGRVEPPQTPPQDWFPVLYYGLNRCGRSMLLNYSTGVGTTLVAHLKLQQLLLLLFCLPMSQTEWSYGIP